MKFTVPVQTIIDPITRVASICASNTSNPDDLAQYLMLDVKKDGITMTGGTSQIQGLDQLIAENTGVQVRLADNPIDCVGIGTGKCFSMLEELKEGFDCASTYTH